MIGTISLLFSIGVNFLAAFSRFTHGRHTPSFYRYQTERAPDDESTRYVPFVDATIGTLLLFPRTRLLAAALCTLFWGIGVYMRLKSGRPAAQDTGLALAAFLTLGTTWLGWA